MSAQRGPDWGRGIVWLFALVFVCAASIWALVWVECALTGGGWSRPKGLELVYALALGLVPLLLALFVIVFLWRTVGPPFSRRRGHGRDPQSRTSAPDEP